MLQAQQLILLILTLSSVSSKNIHTSLSCPKRCECFQVTTELFGASCDTIESLKFIPKDIHTLYLRECSKSSRNITKTIVYLHSFYNLRELHLNNLMITEINPLLFKALKAVLHLDLSRNNISNVEVLSPVIDYLPKLKFLNLRQNPLQCSCESIEAIGTFIKNSIMLSGTINCYNLNNIERKTWDEVEEIICHPKNKKLNISLNGTNKTLILENYYIKNQYPKNKFKLKVKRDVDDDDLDDLPDYDDNFSEESGEGEDNSFANKYETSLNVAKTATEETAIEKIEDILKKEDIDLQKFHNSEDIVDAIENRGLTVVGHVETLHEENNLHSDDVFDEDDSKNDKINNKIIDLKDISDHNKYDEESGASIAPENETKNESIYEDENKSEIKKYLLTTAKNTQENIEVEEVQDATRNIPLSRKIFDDLISDEYHFSSEASAKDLHDADIIGNLHEGSGDSDQQNYSSMVSYNFESFENENTKHKDIPIINVDDEESVCASAVDCTPDKLKSESSNNYSGNTNLFSRADSTQFDSVVFSKVNTVDPEFSERNSEDGIENEFVTSDNYEDLLAEEYHKVLNGDAKYSHVSEDTTAKSVYNIFVSSKHVTDVTSSDASVFDETEKINVDNIISIYGSASTAPDFLTSKSVDKTNILLASITTSSSSGTNVESFSREEKEKNAKDIDESVPENTRNENYEKEHDRITKNDTDKLREMNSEHESKKIVPEMDPDADSKKTTPEKSNTLQYVVIGLLVVAFVAIAVFVILKNRKKKRKSGSMNVQKRGANNDTEMRELRDSEGQGLLTNLTPEHDRLEAVQVDLDEKKYDANGTQKSGYQSISMENDDNILDSKKQNSEKHGDNVTSGEKKKLFTNEEIDFDNYCEESALIDIDEIGNVSPSPIVSPLTSSNSESKPQTPLSPDTEMIRIVESQIAVKQKPNIVDV